MTAHEARQLAQKQLDKRKNAQIELVYQKINTAVKKGEFECFYYGSLPSTVIDELRKDGYNVSDCTDPRDNKITYEIQW